MYILKWQEGSSYKSSPRIHNPWTQETNEDTSSRIMLQTFYLSSLITRNSPNVAKCCITCHVSHFQFWQLKRNPISLNIMQHSCKDENWDISNRIRKIISSNVIICCCWASAWNNIFVHEKISSCSSDMFALRSGTFTPIWKITNIKIVFLSEHKHS